MNLAEPIVQRLNSIQRGAIVVAAVGILFGLFGVFIDTDHWFRTYLLAYSFWLDLALGCLGILFLTNLVESRWGFAAQRIMAAGARTIPLMAALFLPILLGLSRIYPWAANPATEFKYGEDYYFVGGFFVVRAVIYFVIWSGLAYIVSQWLYRSDANEDQGLLRRSQRLSMLGMILFFITVTFSSIDWLLSVDAHWFSSSYGWAAISRMALMAISFAIIVTAILRNDEKLSGLLTPQVKIDYGTIMLAALMAWIYLNFMQYFIMWSANLPYEVFWYIERLQGNWSSVMLFIVIFHALALLTLLTPGVKRQRELIIALAGLLLVLRLAEYFWLIMPPAEETLVVRWWDFMMAIGLGGVWVYAFIWSLKQQSIVAENHPQTDKFLGARGAHGDAAPAPAGD